ncbi:MAG: hypothetical protein J3R72DRAFT_455782 [Linnemannia gamsii]|nr:MAG: hypothetical protein J3R72DRAFT_455782 [Linnemannia gamsii]
MFRGTFEGIGQAIQKRGTVLYTPNLSIASRLAQLRLYYFFIASCIHSIVSDVVFYSLHSRYRLCRTFVRHVMSCNVMQPISFSLPLSLSIFLSIFCSSRPAFLDINFLPTKTTVCTAQDQ